MKKAFIGFALTAVMASLVATSDVKAAQEDLLEVVSDVTFEELSETDESQVIAEDDFATDSVDVVEDDEMLGKSYYENHTENSAYVLKPNVAVSDNYQHLYTPNFYKLEVTKPAVIQLEFGRTYTGSKQSEWHVYFYGGNTKQDFAEFLVNQADDAPVKSAQIGVNPGTYFVKVEFPGLPKGDYTVKINYKEVDNWEKEFNGTFNSATPITTEKTFYGTIFSTTHQDDDYYAFDIKTKGLYNIKFTRPYSASGADFDATLYDANKEKIAHRVFKYNDDADAYLASGLFEVGRYYIKVTKGTVGVQYSLNVSPVILPFKDVKYSDWFAGPVSYVYDFGIMSGVPGNRFDSKGNCTREQVVCILYNSVGKPRVKGINPFQDVNATKYFYDAVVWAKATGVTSGESANWFGAGEPVTREMIAKFLYNFAYLSGEDVSSVADLGAYKDAGSVSSWARSAMRWAVGQGIINGTPDGRLNPKGNTSRAEMAKMIMCYQLSYQ